MNDCIYPGCRRPVRHDHWCFCGYHWHLTPQANRTMIRRSRNPARLAWACNAIRQKLSLASGSSPRAQQNSWSKTVLNGRVPAAVAVGLARG